VDFLVKLITDWQQCLASAVIYRLQATTCDTIHQRPGRQSIYNDYNVLEVAELDHR